MQISESSSKVPRVELTKIVRQKDETGIPGISRMIRHGKTPSFKSSKAKQIGVSFVECDTESKDMLSEIFEAYELQGGSSDQVQILGVLKNSGNASVVSINRELQNIKSINKDKLELPGKYFSIDDPVLFTVNDYDKGIYNGSLGVVTDIIDNDGETALEIMWDDGQTRVLTKSEVRSSLELSYCVTVHKAQGSQFKRIIIPIYKSRLLDRTMIYTALTRGVEQITLVGSYSAFMSAVSQESRITKRMVAFSM